MTWYGVTLIVILILVLISICSVKLYRCFFKRFFDIALSLIALILLCLPMLAVALCIKFTMGSPVIFRQRRIGKDDQEFKLMKFRSMSNDRDQNGVFLPDEERITKVGSFIRKTSIDELPSLLNILKGDMSIIGPRPLPVRYLERYNEFQRRRHEVRPGLSCPSVINGRNIQTWEQQFQVDVWYVDHMSFVIDLKSVLKTILVVLSRNGATAEDGGARDEFIGIADIDALKTDDEGNYMKIRR